MRKSIRLLFLLSGLCISFTTFALTSNKLPTINAASLKKYDGKNGHKAYVALNGLVYDVSDIPQWKGGKHFKGKVAGVDLTPYIDESPHGPGIVNDLNLKPIAVYSRT